MIVPVHQLILENEQIQIIITKDSLRKIYMNRSKVINMPYCCHDLHQTVVTPAVFGRSRKI